MKKFVMSLFKDSFLKNSIYLMVSNCAVLFFGFFFWIIASRYYTPSDIGTTSAILSSMALISAISTVGMPTALLFFLPRSKNASGMIDSCLMVGMTMSTIVSIIFISGLKIWEPVLRTTFNIQFDIIFVIITIMTTTSLLMTGSFTAGSKSSFHMIKENTFGIVRIFPLLLFIGLGPEGIFLSWGLGLVMAMIIGFILLNKTWKYSPTFSFDPTIKEMAAYSTGNYIAAIFSSLPTLLLPIMIINLTSTASAGYFFITMTIAGILYGVPQSIGNVFLAQSSYSDKDYWNKISKAMRFNLSILFVGLLLFIIFGKTVLNIFNHSYAENATITLIILAMTSIPLSVTSIFITIRYSQRRVWSAVKINGFVAITTLALSIPLIKAFSIEGAAIAYLIANSVAALVVIIRIKNPKEFTLQLLKVKKEKGEPT